MIAEESAGSLSLAGFNMALSSSGWLTIQQSDRTYKRLVAWAHLRHSNQSMQMICCSSDVGWLDIPSATTQSCQDLTCHWICNTVVSDMMMMMVMLMMLMSPLITGQHFSVLQWGRGALDN
jgi:hypothetical protein